MHCKCYYDDDDDDDNDDDKDVTVMMTFTVVVVFVFSERELKFTFAICRRPSVCLSVVCRLSVCNVRAPYSGD